ncbi:MAG: ABC transporter substrate-binding protein [Acidithiobacillus sp.]|nr:ABC transporter substrate-binding protein [Acidithiobacillus sp.]
MSSSIARKFWLWALFALALSWGPLTLANDNAQAAAQVVERMTHQVLQILQKNQGKPVTPAIKKEVADAIVPHIDFQTMSAYVMAAYWRQMSPAQQQRFSQLFQDLLVKTYSNALNQYHGQQVTIQGSQQISQNPPVAQVNMNIQQPGQKSIPVIYALIRENNSWKIYNVYIDGVSLVLNYRQEFGNIAAQQGIPGLLTTLQQKVADAGTTHAQ